MHLFNSEHPAYALDLWADIVKNIGVLKKGFTGELDGFDLTMIKRQLFHMTFLDQTPDDPYEVIAYNDSERLDNYSGISKAWSDYHNSGLAEASSGLSFMDYLKLPNWFADWLITNWADLVRTSDAGLQTKAIEDELKRSEREMRKNNYEDPFKGY